MPLLKHLTTQLWAALWNGCNGVHCHNADPWGNLRSDKNGRRVLHMPLFSIPVEAHEVWDIGNWSKIACFVGSTRAMLTTGAVV